MTSDGGGGGSDGGVTSVGRVMENDMYKRVKETPCPTTPTHFT